MLGRHGPRAGHNERRLAAGRAIKYTTVAPSLGLAESPRNPRSPARVIACPNPFRTSVVLHLTARPLGNSTTGFAIFDNTGRVVRTLAGTNVTWDGRDDTGRQVAPGIYFARATAPGTQFETKLVLTR